MSTKPKLTKEQWDFLAEIARRPVTVMEGYKPALALKEPGLAWVTPHGLGTIRVSVTPTGIRVLAEEARS